MKLTHLTTVALHLFEDERGRKWAVAIDSSHGIADGTANGEVHLRDGSCTARLELEGFDAHSILDVSEATDAIKEYSNWLLEDIHVKRLDGSVADLRGGESRCCQ